MTASRADAGAGILALIAVALLGSPPSARADQMGLEAGLMMIFAKPYGIGPEQAYGALGILGRASYETGPWSLGVLSRGAISARSPFAFSSDDIEVEGDLSRRFISLGITLRRFLPESVAGGRAFVEAGFFGVQNDLIGVSEVFDLPEVEGEERIFFRGYGVSLGGGYRFRDSPFFVQLSYEYQKYDWLQVVGTRDLLNYVVLEQKLNGARFAHRIFVTFGVTDLF